MINYDDIYEYIVRCNGGTFDAHGRNLEDCKRYAVAVYTNFSFTVPRLTVPIVESMFAKYRAIFNSLYIGGLGFWYNTEDLQWYIEAVLLCPDRYVAEFYAREYKQLAYYHLDCTVPVEERCIYVKEKP